MQRSNIESGVQFFSRVGRKTSLQGINPRLFPEGGPYPNQIIEITSDATIDKTNLLIDFIVRTILPINNYEKKSDIHIPINLEPTLEFL
ncbi:hypothetical protein NQ318_020998 [Aromia moschata]|uniref:Uncharacterized protein n=1 Tax=Aromia moschata TaxID=1265417 RepID=A0AAV8YN42_9CUCU|nr:hypothetical protein NQ318_020998 [Aromia moschata]